MISQIPTSTARTVTDVTGVAVTTIPAMRLTNPNRPHQSAPSRAPLNARISPLSPGRSS